MPIKRISLLLLLAPALSACDGASSPEGVAPLSGSAIRAHLGVLADDSMYGRRAGSDHELRAARYIRGRFQAVGLEPGVSGYLQSVPIPFPVDGVSGLVSQNVLGVLPGKGSLAGEWVIIGAHYDHMGFSQVNNSAVVLNGADDNASGTAALLEIARFMSDYAAEAGAEEERRSIMFQAYGAEEVGLVGSIYYCEQPTVPMLDVVAMLNLDMLGRLRNDVLIVIGTSSSDDWADVFAEVSAPGMHLVFDDSSLRGSDHYCFYLQNRPVVFFHTGLHAEYHTPFDDVELINLAGLVRVADVVLDVLQEVASRPEPLVGHQVPSLTLGQPDAGVAPHALRR
ncbi:MAG: M28 family peptidase [Gemmatimonadota bacterium]|nr:MAG: M28 family peptidase [Gemmatimonadota bacterium]